MIFKKASCNSLSNSVNITVYVSSAYIIIINSNKYLTIVETDNMIILVSKEIIKPQTYYFIFYWMIRYLNTFLIGAGILVASMEIKKL